MTQASRSVVVNVAPEDFYKVVIDFESYPEFTKDVKEVRIESEGGDEWTVTFAIHIIKRFEYTLHLKGEPGKSLSWTLAKKGFMKQNNGAWRLKDLGDGRTEATYEVDVDLGILAPKSIVNMLLSTNFPAMLKSFKERAEGMF